MPRRFEPKDVLPGAVARILVRDPYWFVIGGHAVRCFCPYRPSRDVDFGVARAKDLESFLGAVRKKGKVKILERAKDTVHLSFDGVDVSIFVLPGLSEHTEACTLTAEGILATKLHAILDRGTRRDFFDLYVMMHQERFGFTDCVRALREVYETDVNEGLVLRAISYFEDADAETSLPGEGKKDWALVKAFFQRAAAALVTPPGVALEIEKRVVDVAAPKKRPRSRVIV